MKPIFAKSYKRSFEKLDPDSQKAIDLAVMRFGRDPDAPGLNYEALNMREKRFRSIRANRDVRVIVLADGPRRVLMYAGHHDDAYDWARKRKGEVNARTGSMQFVEFAEVVREEVVPVRRTVTMPPLFAGEEEAYLLSLGVPPV